MKKVLLVLLGLAAANSSVWAGPYSNGTVGTAWDSSAILEWANQVTNLTRGPQDIENPTGALANFGVAANATGPSDALQSSSNTVSLGDGGSIVLSFANPIGDGPGADFSVFENGFASGTGNQAFLELAFISVSSDGVNFFTFPSVSLTQTATQVAGFGTLDPTDINNLAGKTVAGVGTDFDLSELAGISPLLNINSVQYVKVTDVVGDINPLYATHDSLGNIINDPYSTVFGSGGFDLDAIAVLNLGTVPEPSTWFLAALGLALLIWRTRARGLVLVLFTAMLITGSAQAQTIVDFSGLTPTTSYSEGGAYTNNQAFTVLGLGFNNSYDSTYGSWAGFAYSNTNDQTTSGYSNQYSAAGSGISTFAVGFVDAFTPFSPTITLPEGEQPLSLNITNTVYAELSMKNGDFAAKQFGPGDFFLLTIAGFNSENVSTGSVNFYLANFLSPDPESGYIIQNWTTVDLSSLGAGTDKLVFTETSSDNDPIYGMNTPAYFALGSVTVVPEPSTYALLLIGFGLLVSYTRKRTRA